MSHLERRQREKEEIKQSILDAARQIGREEGWQALTIRKIADRIEYTPPIVYEYFENKEDLIRELVCRGFKLMHEGLLDFDSTDPKELIKQISLVQWDFAANNSDLYQLMFSIEKPTPNEKMVEGLERLRDNFARIAKKDIRQVDEIILDWVCLTRGAITTLLMSPLPPQLIGQDVRVLYIAIIQRFVDSLE